MQEIISMEKKLYRCQCDCGNIKVIIGSRLVSGKVKSCGCIKVDMLIRRNQGRRNHDSCNQRLYRIWQGIKYRTESLKCTQYNDYGGRGITLL